MRRRRLLLRFGVAGLLLCAAGAALVPSWCRRCAAAQGAAPEITVFHGPTRDTMDLFAMYQLVPVLNHLEQIDMWLTGNIDAVKHGGFF